MLTLRQITGPKGPIRACLFRAICSRCEYQVEQVEKMLKTRKYTYSHKQVLRNLVTLERSYQVIQEK